DGDRAKSSSAEGPWTVRSLWMLTTASLTRLTTSTFQLERDLPAEAAAAAPARAAPRRTATSRGRCSLMSCLDFRLGGWRPAARPRARAAAGARGTPHTFGRPPPPAEPAAGDAARFPAPRGAAAPAAGRVAAVPDGPVVAALTPTPARTDTTGLFQ